MTPSDATGGLILRLPFPPTVNTYWRSTVQRHFKNGKLTSSTRVLVSRKGRAYRKAVEQRIWLSRRNAPRFFDDERLRVTVVAYPPDRRKRDLDNLPKGLLDAISKAKVWGDDSQIDDLRLIWGPVEKGGSVLVFIDPLTDNALVDLLSPGDLAINPPQEFGIIDQGEG